jgi:hypothetical protein
MENQKLYKDTEARSIIEYCTMEHEKCHTFFHDDEKPNCKCGETKRLYARDPSQIDANECTCYLESIRCLMKHKGECGYNADCDKEVEEEIRFQKQERDKRKCVVPNPR